MLLQHRALRLELQPTIQQRVDGLQRGLFGCVSLLLCLINVDCRKRFKKRKRCAVRRGSLLLARCYVNSSLSPRSSIEHMFVSTTRSDFYITNRNHYNTLRPNYHDNTLRIGTIVVHVATAPISAARSCSHRCAPYSAAASYVVHQLIDGVVCLFVLVGWLVESQTVVNSKANGRARQVFVLTGTQLRLSKTGIRIIVALSFGRCLQTAK